MTGYRVRRARCLNCKAGLDRAGLVAEDEGRAPKPGDISVCAYCGHLQAYDRNMRFRELTDAEIVECAGEPEMLAAQEFARRFREWRA